jgi:hypothetical protein
MPQQQVAIEQLPDQTAPWVYTLLTNPGVEAWQAGAGPFSQHLAQTADQWQIELGAGSALSVRRDTANAATDSLYCAACTYTHGARSYLRQILEQAVQLRGRTVAFSVQVKCDRPNAVRLGVYDGAYHHGAYHGGGGGYETLTVVATVSTLATVARVVLVFDASCTAYVDNTVLVVGEIPQVYVPLHPQEDTARVLRYRFMLGGLSPNEVVAQVFVTSATTAFGVLRYPVAMAVPPTLTVSAPGDWILYRAGGQPTPCLSIAASEVTRRSCRLDLTCGTPGLGGSASVLAAGSLAARMTFEANVA